MTACVWVVISAALAACASRTPTARERALAQLPADSQVVATADGTALATATFRRVIDAARSHIPGKLGCVVDAALTSEAVAIALQPRVGTTIVIVTRAVVANCPALSKVGDVWVATIGAGTLVSDQAGSVLTDPHWTRARPYLLRDPIAVAADFGTRRVLAVAQPDPIDAWLTIDAIDVEVAEREVQAFLQRWRVPQTLELANKLRTSRNANQVIVRGEGLDVEGLVTLTVDLLRAADTSKAAQATPFVCPPAAAPIAKCTDGTRYVVTNVTEMLRALSVAPALPVVAGGDVIGIKLTEDAALVLKRGDVILGLDSYRVTSTAQFADLVRTTRDHASLAVRRDGTEAVIVLSQQ